MTVEQMRSAILRYYPGSSWLNKVRKMSDEQVIAVYKKFTSEGKKPIKKPRTKYKQLTLEGIECL